MFVQNQKTQSCRTVTEVMDILHEQHGGIKEFLKEKSPTPIKGMDEAVELTKQTFNAGEKVRIIGDYDTDGIMGSVVLYLSMIIKFRQKADVRLPRRFSEGYGLSKKIIDETESGLIFCVDNGIAAVDQVNAAKEKGLKVIIMDHHLVRDDGLVPKADVLVDPHMDENTPFDDWCGAGLAYRFAETLLGKDNPFLPDLLVMASIATVADMVELKMDNRELVKRGLLAARAGRGTLGLRHLIRQTNTEWIDEETYGFLIGPICNASGRLKDDGAFQVFEAMSIMNPKHDQSDLFNRSNLLIETNNARKGLVRKAMSDVTVLLDDVDTSVPIVIWIDDISEGIVGIVAGNLAEEYGVPVLVFTDSKEPGMLKGSGRGGGRCHLKNLMDTHSTLYERYGGHAGAAGMTIRKENLNAVRDAMKAGFQKLGLPPFTGSMQYDLEIPVGAVQQTIKELETYAPYGEGNRKPVFLIKGFECVPVNGSTYRLMGADNEHIKLFGNGVSALGFGLAKRMKADGYPKKVDILGTLSNNHFNGSVYPQIEMVDYMIPESAPNETMASLMELLEF